MSLRNVSNLNRSVIVRWLILFILTCCTITFVYAQEPAVDTATVESIRAGAMPPADKPP